MSDYRRYFVPGGTYFFTVVTHQRRNILTSEIGRQCLRKAFKYVQANRPFTVVAIVLMPDHLHTVWTLPSGDNDYSTRWRRIKGQFSRSFLDLGGSEGNLSFSKKSRQERGIWQRRFWEHTCQGENDLIRCVDYIHWNPVKHGIVPRACDYRWSTFKKFVQAGDYPLEWGEEDPCPGWSQPE